MSELHRDETLAGIGYMAKRKMSVTEIGALIFAIVWVMICIVFFFGLAGTEAGTEKNGVGFVLVVSSVLVPIAVVWLAVASARSARVMTDESERLQASMSAMRKVLIEVQEFQALSPPRSGEKAPRLERETAMKLDNEPAPAFTSIRQHATVDQGAEDTPDAPPMRDVSPKSVAEDAVESPPKPEPTAQDTPDTQTSLELETQGDTTPSVDVNDLIRAINFPENADDEEGFEALRRTLVDRKVASLIQTAQDVLTLLSQDGIYMDDLEPAPAPAKTWRLFASGRRGDVVAPLGGINDRSSLALSAGRMKSDEAFRDAAMQFLQRFDEVLTDAEPRMSDAQVMSFASTRTSRAFMLLGRVTGAFK